MRIVFIGSGNIAHFFASRLQAAHDIVQVYSRSLENAEALARLCSVPSATDDIKAIRKDADIYILAVRDNALPDMAAVLRLPGKVVLHCAGAVDIAVLQPVSEHLGVIWALYSIKKNNLPADNKVPLIVEANTALAREKALELAGNISASVLETDYRQRQMLHLSAVFVNNFTNHLLAIAQKIGEEQQLPFEILQPIIRQTVEQTGHILPSESQTGPAIRRDEATIRKHLDLLAAHPDWQQIYAGITASIQHLNTSNLNTDA